MKPIAAAGAILSLLLLAPAAPAVDTTEPGVRAFIDSMVEKHDFDREALEETLAHAERQQAIIDAISRPAEKVLNWTEYRRIFLTRERIEAGAEFWREHGDMLARIAAESGVPEEMLVGIIGVETYFGRITGGYRVLDALATLAFYYPPRASFFRRELESYLLLVREESMDARDPIGSYAGAMGRPQFMPSSYLAYAVDASGDGQRDIWNDWADVAGSIANYFNEHGWKQGEPVATRATLGKGWTDPVPSAENKLKADDTIGGLSARGVMFATGMPDAEKAALLTYETDDGREHWIGFHNFFVITRYNHSAMYALAVYQLGQEIGQRVQSDAR